MPVNLNAQAYGATGVDTGPVTINSTSAWILVGIYLLGGAKAGGLVKLVNGSGGALAHLKFTRSETIGGAHVDFLVDTDFNTATVEMIDCVVPGSSPPNLYQLALSTSGHVKLDKLNGVAELGIYAKKASADTTLQAIASFF